MNGCLEVVVCGLVHGWLHDLCGWLHDCGCLWLSSWMWLLVADCRDAAAMKLASWRCLYMAWCRGVVREQESAPIAQVGFSNGKKHIFKNI